MIPGHVTETLRVSNRRFILAAALLSSALAAGGCDQLQPRLTFQSMTIQKLGLESADYLAMCEVENPNDFQLRIEDVSWSIRSGQVELLSGSSSKPTELPADRSVPLNLDVHLPLRAIREVGLDSLPFFPYRFEMTAHVSGPIGPIEIRCENSGRFPVIQPMTVKLTSIEMIGTSETRVGIALTAEVANPNVLALAPSALVGQLFINERPLVEIDTMVSNPIPLTAGHPQDLRLVVWVRSPEVGVRSLAEMLQRPDTRFRLTGTMLFRLPGNGDINDLLTVGPTAQPAQATSALSPTTQPD
ncbi:MAG: hypothetical protein BIFFINMI_03238 [Phycisphaerae bacterium]|nr:hypothetical protein [Phycisphaerae bacterium]